MTDRAVSETLGFVLVFGLVITTVGIVYATGIGGLESVQAAERTENVGRAFEVLADNVADLSREGAPARATEIRLNGGMLSVEEPVNVTVRAERVGDPSDNATFVIRPEPVVYRAADRDTRFTYAAGAVFRTDRGASTMRVEPEFRHDADRAVVPFVRTRLQGNASGIGGGTALVVTRRVDGDLAGQFRNGSAQVTVTVTSPRADAWKRYFEDEGFDAVDADASDGDVAYRFVTDRLYVPETVVDVELRH